MKKLHNHFARGKYCTICQQVWELDRTIGREVKYPEMPSYGLKREQCSSCKEPPKSFKNLPSTLAEKRHKTLLWRIKTENKKLFNKNVKNASTKEKGKL